MGCHSNGNTKHENWSSEFNRIFSSFCHRRKNDFFRWAKQPNANSNHQYSQVCGKYFNPIQETFPSKNIRSKKYHNIFIACLISSKWIGLKKSFGESFYIHTGSNFILIVVARAISNFSKNHTVLICKF